jgi:hypothetical protein
MPAPGGFAVNLELSPELQRIFDNTPEDESRSRFEPYRELILLWRRGRSYRRICRSLQEQCGCSVAHSTLRRFVQRHYRPRKGQPEVQAEEPITTPAVPEQTAARPRLSLEERIAQRDAIRAAHNKPAIHREDPRPVFTFDPSKPPTNKNYEQGGKSGNSNSSD